MTSLSDPEHHFRFGNLMKNLQFFDKKRLFITYRNKYQHLFINRKAKLTFGKNMLATGHTTAVAKMNPSYLSGGANVHSFHHLSGQISLPHYTVSHDSY